MELIRNTKIDMEIQEKIYETIILAKTKLYYFKKKREKVIVSQNTADYIIFQRQKRS